MESRDENLFGLKGLKEIIFDDFKDMTYDKDFKLLFEYKKKE